LRECERSRSPARRFHPPQDSNERYEQGWTAWAANVILALAVIVGLVKDAARRPADTRLTFAYPEETAFSIIAVAFSANAARARM